MKRVDVYNSEYVNLNHAYILMYDAYQKLIECDDDDTEVMFVLTQVLSALNPVLDKIKSEMTVTTRFKDGSKSSQKKNSKEKSDGKDDGYIITGNFGDN